MNIIVKWKKNITNKIYTFQLNQMKRFPARSWNIYSSFSFSHYCPWCLVLHNKKYAGMEWKIKMGNLPGTHENKRSKKGFSYHKRGCSCYVNSGTMQDHGVQSSRGWEGLPASRLTHHTAGGRTKDTSLTIPFFNCTSSLGSAEQLKPEVLKLFFKRSLIL